MPVDVLQPLFESFRVHAEAFFMGNLCGVADYRRPQDRGHLHLVRRGRGEIRFTGGRRPLRLEDPGLILFPRHLPHQVVPDGAEGLDLVCASVAFGTCAGNPLAQALPEILHLGMEQTGALAEVLVREAFGAEEGRQGVVDRLCEVVVVHFLRRALREGRAQAGLLAGLAHPQLGRALTALHGDPARCWTLEDMAAEAGLSRSGFAAAFKEALGVTPGEHLARFRISVAQERLAQGIPLKVVAHDVGYGSSSALSRAFRELTGTSPRAWLQAKRPGG